MKKREEGKSTIGKKKKGGGREGGEGEGGQGETFGEWAVGEGTHSISLSLSLTSPYPQTPTTLPPNIISIVRFKLYKKKIIVDLILLNIHAQ